jgi:16S rRNA (guanine(527)-N(7))-methyltransferase RsmG
MMEESAAAKDFLESLERNAEGFGVQLSAGSKGRLQAYFQIVTAWNARLHLVAPCPPEEFATRHVLESLVMLPHLTDAAHVLDVGSGAGLPALPCLSVCPDLRATLIESHAKKAVFLREALRAIGAGARAQVVAKRFEETLAPEADVVTCRALERLTEKFAALVAWSPPATTLLLFGGPTLEAAIRQARLAYQRVLIPRSERRFLFIIKRDAPDHAK